LSLQCDREEDHGQIRDAVPEDQVGAA